MIERRFDEETGIIYVTATGNWTLPEIDAHYDAMRALIADLRAEGRAIRVLSDVSGSSRQTPEVEAHIVAQVARTFEREDRVALVTKDPEAKAYVRAIVEETKHITAFASRLPAEMWLLLDASRTGD